MTEFLIVTVLHVGKLGDFERITLSAQGSLDYHIILKSSQYGRAILNLN
jgi:hypothetical protein